MKYLTVSDFIDLMTRKSVRTINEELSPAIAELWDDEIMEVELKKEDVFKVEKLYNDETDILSIFAHMFGGSR